MAGDGASVAREGWRRFRRPLLRGVVALVSLLVFAELGARAAWPFLTTQDERRTVAHFLAGERSLSLAQGCAPHPYALYQPAPNLEFRGHLQHNSLGFRGRELRADPDVRRVVCLGGSTTYSWSVRDPARSYPARLEELLRADDPRIEVVNAGLPMGTTAELLATLQFRVLPLEPRLVILHVGLNDVFPTLMPGYRADYTHDRRPWKFNESLKDQVLFRSRAWALFAVRRLQATDRLTFATYVRPEHWDWERNCREALREAEDDARYLGFRNNVRSIAAICAERGVPLVVAPTTLRPGIEGELPALALAYGRNVRILRELADASEGVHFADTVALPGLTRKDFQDECHLREDGVSLKARVLADFLRERGLVPR